MLVVSVKLLRALIAHGVGRGIYVPFSLEHKLLRFVQTQPFLILERRQRCEAFEVPVKRCRRHTGNGSHLLNRNGFPEVGSQPLNGLSDALANGARSIQRAQAGARAARKREVMNVANQDRGSGLDLLGMIKKLQEPLEVFEQFLRGAEFFLKENHEVYGFDKNISSIQHPKYTHFCLDIRDKSSYPEIGQVDILINNAGVQNGDDIDVNLKGTISVTEHYGIHPNIYSVIMIGSASGHTGSEFPEYAASKGGVLAYTKNVAMRIAPYQATCNSLDFGGVMTELNRPVMEDEKLWDQIMELTPLKRWMSVEEAAEWIYFMAVKNRFCTGQNILIDGLEAGNCNFIWP